MQIVVSTDRKITVRITKGELVDKIFTASAYRPRRSTDYVWSFSLPLITFRHHDRVTAEEIIACLEAIAQWGMKLNRGNARFTGHAQPAEISQLNHYKIPVFQNNIAKRYCEIVRDGPDDYWRWIIYSHTFANDAPSISAYIATITQLIIIAYGTR